MIDFHCHITTPGSKLPERQGENYKTLKPLTDSGSWIDVLWAETIETVAENYRNDAALRNMRMMSPVIYSEMVRRLLQADSRRLTQEMARNQVRQSVVVAIDPIIPTDEVVAVCEATKGILLPFGSVDPWAEDWKAKLRRTLAAPIAGFKFHSSLQRLTFGDRRTYEILEELRVAGFRKPIFLHTGDYPIYAELENEMDWVNELRAMVASFPMLTFVCGHSGWNRPGAVCRIAKHAPNLWLETSWQPPRVLRRICRMVGPERLVLGSDYPLSSQKRAIRNCRLAFSPREFEIVTEETPRALLAGGSVPTLSEMPA